ncbi:MAG: hypothetical protein HY909_28670 [Deltaproteobacteria bacterium]|nr:hypothetical protein [Deltaproteobacteria bacterium]
MTAYGDLAELEPRAALPVLPGARCVCDPERDLVVALTGSAAVVLRGCFLDGEVEETVLPLPEGSEAHGLALRGAVLWVAGRCGDELLLSRDLDDPRGRWVPLEVPPEVRKKGKAVDDLVLCDRTLLALDDIIFPKYLLRYDVTDPRAPALLGRHELPVHGTYERYRRGACGERAVALLSSTFGRGGTGFHVSFLEREGYRSRGAFTLHQRGLREGPEEPPVEGVAMVGDQAVLALGAGGVGVLDAPVVRALCETPARQERVLDRLVYEREGIPREALRELPLPGLVVLDVVAVSADVAVAVVKRPDGSLHATSVCTRAA